MSNDDISRFIQNFPKEYHDFLFLPTLQFLLLQRGIYTPDKIREYVDKNRDLLLLGRIECKAVESEIFATFLSSFGPESNVAQFKLFLNKYGLVRNQVDFEAICTDAFERFHRQYVNRKEYHNITAIVFEEFEQFVGDDNKEVSDEIYSRMELKKEEFGPRISEAVDKLNEQMLILLLGTLEIYLAEDLSYLYGSIRDLVLSSEPIRKRYGSLVGEGVRKIIDTIVEKETITLRGWKDLKKEYKRIGIEWERLVKDYNDFEQCIQARHTLIHNLGIVKAGQIISIFGKDFRDGERIEISYKDIESFGNIIYKLAECIDRESVKIVQV